MTEASMMMLADARSVRARLQRPPNAVVDHGIDLRRRSAPPPAPPPRPRIVIQSPVVAEQQAKHRRREVPVDEIAKIVADFYSVPMEDVIGPRRTAILAKTRQVISHLAHALVRRSYPEIGRALKYRDHTTALYGDRLISARLLHDSDCAEEIQTLKALIEKQQWRM